MAINVLVNGALGRMGSLSCEAIEADSDLKLVARSDKGDDLASLVTEHKADVVVDFTVASVSLENARLIVEAGARPVIGTSGFTAEQVDKVSSLCAERSVGGIIAPNFSISAVLMMKFAAAASKYMPDCEIIEYHHPGKEDSPSGTALKTAELVAAGREVTPKVRKDKEIIPGSRGAELNSVRIHALRLPGVIANQEVVFGGLDQTLTIKSDCLSREAFMPGVCLSCKKVMGLDKLVYGLENIL